ncbi:MAG: OmpA family protein [Flavobacteriales bacterium]|jgi:chemotaxis protein MotB|nr:OmpA family protein [Bacteroidota bacterium]MDP4588005.1 OmpA family protein [Flavobacteriales bacterium]MDP4665223.1 OmpA family protein [Flavobacteriaceae bacterium]MDP4952196.1 OmpA family protein [Flavobacteriales bacterium]
MKSFFAISIMSILVLSSCVSGRQFEELQTKEKACAEKNAQLMSQNEQLSAEMKESASLQESLLQQKLALQNDTAFLGTTNRQLRSQYDKINELNDILVSKNTKMMSDVTTENKKLLADLQKTQEELQMQEDELRILEGELNTKEANIAQMSSALEEREQRVKELEELIAKKDAAVNDLKNRVSEALLGFKDKGLTVEQKNGKVYVSLEAKLLFPSGSTSINEEGKKALIDLAKAIENEADLEVIVEGHTDTDKIRSNTIPSDNWELSVLRATAVVKIMVNNSAVEPKILSASGRSEYHPVDEEDKSKNRRIEIILSPNLNELFDLIEQG